MMVLDCPKTIATGMVGRREWRQPQRPAATRQNARLKDHSKSQCIGIIFSTGNEK